MNISNQSIQSFFSDRGNNSNNRLYVRNKELHYDNKIGGMTLFAAKLGFGCATMSNVAKFIRKHPNTCFTGQDSIITYNDFVTSYNDKQSISWKKAKHVNFLYLEIFKSEKDINYDSRDEIHQLITHHLKNAKLLFNQSDISLPQLSQTLKHIQGAIEEWQTSEKLTTDEKKTLNEILELKNQIRASIFPANGKALKGPQTNKKRLVDQNKKNEKILKSTLKDMRAAVLKKRFAKRLEEDQLKLDALTNKFHMQIFSESAFLANQLNRWQKKLDEGKPIAIPKWYHCTKSANTVDTILNTDILFMHKRMFAGAFVSNKPELDIYGSYCIMLSDRIEKTGTKIDDNHKTILYPLESTPRGNVQYRDQPLILKTDEEHRYRYTKVWLGFQKGKNTLNGTIGTEGIPIKRADQIANGSLTYYKDTTVGFIFDEYNTSQLKKIGKERRVQVITNSESTALIKLIETTFAFSLPSDWEGKISNLNDAW